MPDLHAHLPDAALALSARLQALIRDEIHATPGRAIPFYRFMELALYTPGLGYYSAGMAKFGAEGDFVTAPELGTLFAGAVAEALAPVLRQLGADAQFVEIGGGSGRFAEHAIRRLARVRGPPSSSGRSRRNSRLMRPRRSPSTCPWSPPGHRPRAQRPRRHRPRRPQRHPSRFARP